MSIDSADGGSAPRPMMVLRAYDVHSEDCSVLAKQSLSPAASGLKTNSLVRWQMDLTGVVVNLGM